MLHTVSEKTFSSDVLGASQPVLVHFWAPWCGLCKLVNPLLLQCQAEWQGQLTLIEVNADQNFRLANTYRLKSLPTLIWFEQGQIIQRLDSFRNRDDLQQKLGALINAYAVQSV